MFLTCLFHLLSQFFGLESVDLLPLYTNYDGTERINPIKSGLLELLFIQDFIRSINYIQQLIAI